jgi:hypothetical protein
MADSNKIFLLCFFALVRRVHGGAWQDPRLVKLAWLLIIVNKLSVNNFQKADAVDRGRGDQRGEARREGSGCRLGS